MLAGTGFFSPLAESFWTDDGVFFTNLQSGTPPSGERLARRPIVEKGGVAQRLRESTTRSAAGRNVYTLPERRLRPDVAVQHYTGSNSP